MITLEAGQTLAGVAGTAAAVTFTILDGDEITAGVDAFKRIAQSQLPSSVATIYTATGVTALIGGIALANTTASPVSGIKFFVGGTLAANQITGSITIPANGTCLFDGTVIRVYDSTGTVVSVQLASNVQYTPTGTISATDVQAALTELDTEKIPFTALDVDGTLAANSDTRVPSQKAVKTYADQLIASADAMVFKGVIDCSASPNYPAADRGHTYRVSVAGKIGGASGTNVEAGDLLLCLTDGTAAGTQAAVGANWSIAQSNIDGAVTGPASSTDGGLALYNGTTGKVVKGDGLTVSNDDILQRKAGAWANRTPVQLMADLPDAVAAGASGRLTGADKTKLNNTTGTNSGDVTLAAVGSVPNGNGASLSGQALTLQPASAAFPGLLPAAQSAFLSAFNGSGIIFVTANAYSNLAVDGATDDTAACQALLTSAPDGSTLVWPGQNRTMVLSAAVTIPGGKHYICVGGGPGSKTNILQTSPTADHFTCGDWYSTFTGFNFTTNNTTTTGVQALTSGTVLNVAAMTTALIPASGSITIGSAAGWQVLTYSARTSTTVTLSSTGTGSSIAGAPVVFKTAGAAINAGNLVGIDCTSNSFAYVFNGYVCAGSTANQSRITGNGFLNTINFDIWIDGANWNGIIDSNTCDCTTNSRSVSHCEITQCGSVTGQGNQFIRGQFNMRLGSTTAAYPAGVFGVYFTNSFFDNAGTDAVRIQGISAVQRVKLTSCWLSSAAQKGLNFASTATTLPTDIEIVGCNIYSNGTDGIGGAGVADYKVIGGQVAGNVTNGFNIAAATGNVYSVFAQGVRIGPTGGIGANGTGITIAAGTYTQIKFDNCEAIGNTTAFTAGAVTMAAGASRYAITNCPGINPRGTSVAPAVPATTVAATNTTGFPVHVYLRAGTVSAAAVNGIATGITATPSGTGTYFCRLSPGGTIAITYTVAPTWVWIAD